MLPAFHRLFDLPHDWQHHIPAPYPYRHAVGSDPQAVIDASVAALKAKVADIGADNVAAFFAEPVPFPAALSSAARSLMAVRSAALNVPSPPLWPSFAERTSSCR